MILYRSTVRVAVRTYALKPELDNLADDVALKPELDNLADDVALLGDGDDARVELPGRGGVVAQRARATAESKVVALRRAQSDAARGERAQNESVERA